MAEINLLDRLPTVKRDLDNRIQSVTAEDRQIARQFGREFFDGPRNQGYGGYRYDGRWRPVAKRFQEHYGLTAESRILDVGCGKGFLLHDFLETIPGVSVAGLDISEYAISHGMEDVARFLQVGDAKKLPYPDKSFDLVISINTIHNLNLEELKNSLREIERVSRKDKFIVIDAYRTAEDKARLLKWNLTAQTHMYCEEWKKLFEEVNYTGDYYWFIP